MKVAAHIWQMEKRMKTFSRLAMLPSIFCLFVAFGSITDSANAAPARQDKASDLDKSELEQMIMKKIEEKRKQNEAEAAKNGGKTSSKKAVPRRPVSSRPSSLSRKPVSSLGTRATAPKPTANSRNPDHSSSTSPTGGGGIPRVKAEPREAELTEHTEMKGSINTNVDPDVRIRFSFADDEWKDVIEWFAEQAGFGVYFGTTGPPQGTFDYFDAVERTVIEGLDLLNSRLAILQPSHVLVRNGTQLVLVNESLPYPDHLIARILPEELDEYGMFEVVSCQFDLGKLNGNQLALELREDVSQVHLDGFAYVQSANRLIIRERVRVLRRFADIIKYAIDAAAKTIVSEYLVKNSDAESLLAIAKPMLGFEGESNSLAEGDLRLGVDAIGSKIFLKGSPDRIAEFIQIAEKIDSPIADSDQLVEVPYFQTHRISGGDTEVIFQVLQTMLDGEPNVKMDQDTNNGNIYLEAPKRVHDSVSDFLANLNPGDSFAEVPVKNLSPSDIISKVEELLGIDGFEPPDGSPRLVEDSDLDRILVFGTPQQITQIRSMIETIDGGATSTDIARRPTRLVPLSPRQQQDVMDILKIDGVMELKGRKNRLNLIMPEDRDDFRNRIRFERSRPAESEFQDADPNARQQEQPKDNPARLQSTKVTTTKARNIYVSSHPQEETRTGSEQQIGQTTEEEVQPSYQLSEEEPSVPGAPIEVRMTEQGLMIRSYDLDAADDLESLIKEWVDVEAVDQLPTIFYLDHRKVEEAKSILEHLLGIESSSGGGGGGGITNLIGGAMQNAVGGAAGDALSGLFGGGGGSGFSSDSAGALELEGEDVRLGTDVRFNTLIVTGATDNDIDIITELIEYIDQPGPPQNPRIYGETREIRIKYRDPMEVKDLVQSQLPGYFSQPSNSGGGNQQNARQQIEQQIAKQLQQGLQGNRGNKGGSSSSSQQPKATLGVDEINRMLLVTGPEFIYEAVVDVVNKIDVKAEILTVPLNTGPFSTSALAEIIKQHFGDKVNVVDPEEEAGGQSTGSKSTAGGANRGGGTNRGGASSGRTNSFPRAGGGGGGRNNNSNQALERAILNQIQGGGRGNNRNPGLGGGGRR